MFFTIRKLVGFPQHRLNRGLGGLPGLAHDPAAGIVQNETCHLGNLCKYFEQSTKIMTSGYLLFRPRIFAQPRTELFLLRFLTSRTHDTFQLGNFLVSVFKKLALFKKGLQNGHRFLWRIAFSHLFLVWGLVQFCLGDTGKPSSENNASKLFVRKMLMDDLQWNALCCWNCPWRFAFEFNLKLFRCTSENTRVLV